MAELVEAVEPGLVARLPLVRTPGKGKGRGRHVYARSSGPAVATAKLARMTRAEAEERTGDAGRTTTIEVKAMKGYVLAVGCPTECHETGRLYEHIGGPPIEETPILDEQEVDLLLACARAMERGDKPCADKTPPGAETGGVRPGDDYNRRAQWAEVLPAGWKTVRENGEVVYLRRPGKDAGISATIGHCKTERAGPKLYIFSTNAQPFEEGKAYSKFEAFTLLKHGGDFKAAARDLAANGYGSETSGALGGDAGDDARPAITISTEEHLVNDEAVKALARDTSLYQRGGLLVRIVRDKSPATEGWRRPFGLRIDELPRPLLQERLTANARWLSMAKDGPTPAHPPGWCVSAVHARAEWEGVRHLEAAIDSPVLKPDGSLLTTTGYDPEIALYFEPAGATPDMPEHPTKDDAVAARKELLGVVRDFPFASKAHKAAWLAGMLTPLARFAFAGPSPLFLVDANVRGAGKGLLLNAIAHVITGTEFSTATYTNDEAELRKRITSLAMKGDRLVLFDNLAGKFGNAVLDAALTTTCWEDRVLGGNHIFRGPLYVTWFATGNNVHVGADTCRRICHVRLESGLERPELRKDFRHPRLLDWVRDHRPRLLGAALTLLRAYCVAGMPDLGLPAWGSFEGWSSLVRNAVVWCGMPDPGETRIELQETSDTEAIAMQLLLTGWQQMDPAGRGSTVCARHQRAVQGRQHGH